MQIIFRKFRSSFLLCCLAYCICSQNLSAEPASFTIAVLPDTQFYSEKHPDIFNAQTKWIAKNASKLHLLCVVHEGDVVNRDVEKQWKAADAAMTILDKHRIPYCIAIGNHDCVEYKERIRNTQNFNKYFGIERISKKKWYGGSRGNEAENSYYLFEAAGDKILVMCLEFGPRDEVLDWANHIAAKYPDRHIIVVTHAYMYYDRTRIGPGDKSNPHKFLTAANDGEEMWDKFVRKHNNIILVLSGHIHGAAKLTSLSDYKTKVTQILVDYQTQENGGNGWLRLMKFVPAEDKIIVETYSPILKKYNKDPNDCFVIEDAGLFTGATEPVTEPGAKATGAKKIGFLFSKAYF